MDIRFRCRQRVVVSVRGAALLCIAALGACFPTQAEVSQRPAMSGQTSNWQTAPSTIAARASIPLAEVAGLVDAKVARQFDASGDGKDACADLGLLGKRCIGTTYTLRATRYGTVSAKANSGTTMRISLPVAFEGQGAFKDNGEIDRRIIAALSIGRKNFRGSAILHLDVRPTIDADACPKLRAAADFEWTREPQVEIVDKVWINVREPVEDSIRKQLPRAVAAIENAIECDPFKAELARVYGSRTFPLTLPGSAGTLHVNVKPMDIGFSGFEMTPTDVIAALTLTAEVEVADKPLTPAAMPLPPLRQLDTRAPSMALAVPLRAPYAVLTALVAKAVVGKTFEQSSAAGKIVVKILGTELYPSNGKIVIGLDFEADAPGSAPDIKGQVYLLGTPTVDSSGTRIALPDASYAAVLDSLFWQGASSLFEGQIRQAIRRAAVYDLGADVSKARAAIEKALADPGATPGFVVRLSAIDMKLGRVVAAADAFAIEALFNASATIAVSSPRVKP